MARGKIYVDVAFWGGVIPGNQDELQAMVKQGVVGFKCFLCPSGVPEFPNVNASDVEIALQKLQDTESVLAVSLYTINSLTKKKSIELRSLNKFQFHAEVCSHTAIAVDESI